MTDTNKEDPLLPFFPEPKPYGVYEDTIQVRQIHFYISGPIEEPHQYIDMIHKIRTANQNDIVHIHLNTPGGAVDTGVQIINAMNSSQARVITHLEGNVCSMGSLIFLAGDQMYAYEHCMMMFHNYSGSGFGGKGHEIKSMIEAHDGWFDRIQERILAPFLSKAEMARIKKGEDIWMQSDEIAKRLEKMQKKFEADEAAALAAEESDTSDE